MNLTPPVSRHRGGEQTHRGQPQVWKEPTIMLLSEKYVYPTEKWLDIDLCQRHCEIQERSLESASFAGGSAGATKELDPGGGRRARGDPHYDRG